MTAENDTFTIPYRLTAEELREVRLRWLRKQARLVPLIAVMVVGGAAVPGKLGGVFLGAGLYLIVLVAIMFRQVDKSTRLVLGGALGERRLVLGGGRVGIHSAAGVTWLTATTVKQVVEGNRLVYFDTPWKQWQPIPRHVAHQQGVWARLIEATGQSHPVQANVDRWR